MQIKKKRRDREHLEQIQVIQWAREQLQAGVYWELELLYAVMNGVRVAMMTAIKAKNEGMNKGIPDLCLPVSHMGFHSLYIEMKIRGGVVGPDQKRKISLLRKAGNLVFVAYSALEAITMLQCYLENVMYIKP